MHDSLWKKIEKIPYSYSLSNTPKETPQWESFISISIFLSFLTSQTPPYWHQECAWKSFSNTSCSWGKKEWIQRIYCWRHLGIGNFAIVTIALEYILQAWSILRGVLLTLGKLTFNLKSFVLDCYVWHQASTKNELLNKQMGNFSIKM